jgi:hypothetical protein
MGDEMNGARQIAATKAANLEISPVQQTVISRLLTGESVTASCAAAGVHRSAFHRWQSDDPAFVLALNAQRNELNEAIKSGLLALAADAVTVIGEVMRDANQPGATRLKAAAAVLDRLDRAPPKPGPTTPDGLMSQQIRRFLGGMMAG